MPAERPLNFVQRLKVWVFGKSLDPTDHRAFHNLSLIAFFAWVGLGADGLSSSAYGPEEAFRALGPHHHLAILVALGAAFTVFVISASYSQVIEVFPNGGGGYTVASKLLSPYAGMVSGCALLIDYVLTIAISLASGADAIFSFLPPEWIHFRMEFVLGTVVLLTWMNLRGAKESVVPLVPVFMIFVLTHFFAIVYAMVVHLFDFATVTQSTLADMARTHAALGFAGTFALLLRSYSMGAGTYTGIEAVSTGMPLFREPRVRTGKRTMFYMATSLAFTVLGLMLAYVFYRLEPSDTKTLNAVLFEHVVAGWNPSIGRGFVWVILFSEAAILFVAAQAGFLGAPRVLANMALDQWLPNRFSLLSDRLVSQNGIMLMGIAAAVTLVLTGASVQYLVVLYSITVFIGFVLTQMGMLRYWWRARSSLEHWRKRLALNAVALCLCTFILIMVIVVKFFEGGWITLFAMLLVIGVSLLAKQHYRNVAKMLQRMDSLVQAAQVSNNGGAVTRIMGEQENQEAQYDPKAKTAVVLVSGFNGLGLHTLFSIIRLFGGIYKNFVFVEIGLIDAGTFKGQDEVEHLKVHVQEELDKYVEFIRRHGYYGEAKTALSHDIVAGSAQLAPSILERFPQSVFFMGQLVFPEESWISRLFHNNAVFAVQRRLYHLGIPFIILPIRVKMRV